jgi:hypothetical protein
MKKIFKILVVACLATLSVAPLVAQETEKPKAPLEIPQHEFGVSYGAFPCVLLMPFFDISYISINLEYHYNFNSRHSISTILNVGFRSNPNDYKNNNPWTVINPQIGYRYTYLQRNNFMMYLSLSVGGNFFYSKFFDLHDPVWHYSAGYHFSPLGFMFGKKHCLTIEIGFGYQGLLKIGYNYKFNKRKK